MLTHLRTQKVCGRVLAEVADFPTLSELSSALGTFPPTPGIIRNLHSIAEGSKALWTLRGPDGVVVKLHEEHFRTARPARQLRDDAIASRDVATVWQWAHALSIAALVHFQHPTRHSLRQVAEDFSLDFYKLDRRFDEEVTQRRLHRIKQLGQTVGFEWETSGEFCAGCYIVGKHINIATSDPLDGLTGLHQTSAFPNH